MGLTVTENSASVDPVLDVPPDISVPGVIAQRGRTRPTEPIVEWCVGPDKWRTLSAGEFVDAFAHIGAAAISWGISEGERVAVMGTSGLEWNLIDLALQAIGAVVVPIYDTSSASQVRAIVDEACIRRGFASGDAVTLLQGAGVSVRDFAWAMARSGLVDEGLRLDDTTPAFTRLRRRRADEVATLVYSSGTTGRPRGVPLTHRNLGGMLIQQQIFFPQAIHDADVRCMLFLPMAHVFARTAAYMPLAGLGVSGHLSDKAGDLVANFQQFRPTTIGAVPRVLEKIEEAARQKANTPVKRRLFAWTQKVSRARAPYVRHDRRVPLRLRVRYGLANRIALGKIQRTLGGNLRCVVSGGAPLDPDLDDFFTGMGIRICNGYGLTESTGGFFCNTFTAAKAGTAGRPLPGCKVRLGEGNELELAGIGIFAGYANDPAADAEAFTEDGWFRSGDIGTIDADGYVSITGRKKDVLVTAGGKNVQPGPYEEAVRRHRLVSQIMLVGDGKKFVSALVTLEQSVERTDPGVLDEIRQALRDANAQVSRAESVRRFVLLDGDFTLDNGLLTPSLKMKRHAILAHYEDVIEGVYSGRLGHDVTAP